MQAAEAVLCTVESCKILMGPFESADQLSILLFMIGCRSMTCMRRSHVLYSVSLLSLSGWC